MSRHWYLDTTGELCCKRRRSNWKLGLAFAAVTLLAGIGAVAVVMMIAGATL